MRKDQGMRPAEIVREYVGALEAGDLARAESHLSDDFAFRGLTPMAMGREQYLELQRAIRAAFPDWAFNLTSMQEDAGVIRATAHITGTQTGDLVLPVPDLPPIRATGRAVSLRDETHLYTVRGTKIAAIYVLVSPGGGFQGLYRQLKVRLPVPSDVAG